MKMLEDRASREGLLCLSDEELRSVRRNVSISDVYCVEDTVFARGKFATVRRASHKTTGVQYAAKYIRKRRRAIDMIPEIYHEVSVLLKCGPSTRVVRLYEVYETNSDVVLILELAAGGELQRIFDGDHCLNETEARRAMRQILEGLCYLHEKNIAHLDLKPQNLLLTVEDCCDDIKLCDFGVSRLLEPGTEVRALLGTPDYVAPEVLSYEPISLATDIWSAGVLAYVLLSGYTPFGADTKQQTYLNISQCLLTFEPEHFDDVSSAAVDFIKTTLVVNPKQRPTIKELLQHPWISQKSHILPPLSLKTADAITTTPKTTPVSQHNDEHVFNFKLQKDVEESFSPADFACSSYVINKFDAVNQNTADQNDLHLAIDHSTSNNTEQQHMTYVNGNLHDDINEEVIDSCLNVIYCLGASDLSRINNFCTKSPAALEIKATTSEKPQERYLSEDVPNVESNYLKTSKPLSSYTDSEETIVNTYNSIEQATGLVGSKNDEEQLQNITSEVFELPIEQSEPIIQDFHDPYNPITNDLYKEDNVPERTNYDSESQSLVELQSENIEINQSTLETGIKDSEPNCQNAHDLELSPETHLIKSENIDSERISKSSEVTDTNKDQISLCTSTAKDNKNEDKHAARSYVKTVIERLQLEPEVNGEQECDETKTEDNMKSEKYAMYNLSGTSKLETSKSYVKTVIHKLKKSNEVELKIEEINNSKLNKIADKLEGGEVIESKIPFINARNITEAETDTLETEATLEEVNICEANVDTRPVVTFKERPSEECCKVETHYTALEECRYCIEYLVDDTQNANTYSLINPEIDQNESFVNNYEQNLDNLQVDETKSVKKTDEFEDCEKQIEGIKRQELTVSNPKSDRSDTPTSKNKSQGLCCVESKETVDLLNFDNTELKNEISNSKLESNTAETDLTGVEAYDLHESTQFIHQFFINCNSKIIPLETIDDV